MGLSRRHFSLIAGSLLFAGRDSKAAATRRSEVRLVLAPSNLGLRPEGGKEPGTWEAPRVLMAAGLRHAVEAAEVISLERPLYDVASEYKNLTVLAELPVVVNGRQIDLHRILLGTGFTPR